MKKKTKKIFGFIGLALVVGITAVACSLPSPKATAAQSLTDTIQVRVVGNAPDVRFNNIENRDIIVYPWQSFSVEYENVANYTLTLTYTDMDGNTTSNVIDSQFVDYATGAKDYIITFDAEGF